MACTAPEARQYPDAVRTEDAWVEVEWLENNPESIRAAGVRSIRLKNCIANDGCYEDTYVFNDCGKVAAYHQAMVGSHYEYVYDSACRLRSSFRVSGRPELEYRYTYFARDSVLEEVFDLVPRDGENPKRLSSWAYRLIPFPHKGAEYDAEGRLASEVLGDLLYPCGIEFPGPHTARYQYLPGGLVQFVSIEDSLGKEVIRLEYLYTLRDSSQ